MLLFFLCRSFYICIVSSGVSKAQKATVDVSAGSSVTKRFYGKFHFLGQSGFQSDVSLLHASLAHLFIGLNLNIFFSKNGKVQKRGKINLIGRLQLSTEKSKEEETVLSCFLALDKLSHLRLHMMNAPKNLAMCLNILLFIS